MWHTKTTHKSSNTTKMVLRLSMGTHVHALLNDHFCTIRNAKLERLLDAE